MMKYIVNFLILFGCVYSLQVIMERAALEEIDLKYIDYGKAYVVRYGRKSPYYLHIEGFNKQTWNNNVTLHLLFYEYLHNEYRRSFVEMHLKLCDAINSDPYVGKMLAKSGLICPMKPGHQRLSNMTIEATEFPNVWPFRKAKVVVNISPTDSSIVMARIAVYVAFVQKNKKDH